MIQIKNLKKKFENQNILNNFTLNIEKNKTTVILGESGCGKTVLLKHLTGFYHSDAGEIIIDGLKLDKTNIKVLNEIRKKLTLVFQHPALFDWLTVYENVALPLHEHTQMKEESVKKKVNEKLDLVGLLGSENKLPSQISLGMQKRVSIARALILNPDYIFFDEPTTGLDPIIAKNIISIIKKLRSQVGTTSVIVSHDISMVYKVADDIAVMKNGRIIFTGELDIFQKSKNSYLQNFQQK